MTSLKDTWAAIPRAGKRRTQAHQKDLDTIASVGAALGRAAAATKTTERHVTDYDIVSRLTSNWQGPLDLWRPGEHLRSVRTAIASLRTQLRTVESAAFRWHNGDLQVRLVLS